MKEAIKMLLFLSGVILGAIIGVTFMCLFQINHNEDDVES